MSPATAAPTAAAVAAFRAAVAALETADHLLEGPDGRGAPAGPSTVEQDAAYVAVKATVATFLAIVSPGGEPGYYLAAAHEIHARIFDVGAGVAEALTDFLASGWRYTSPTRSGHRARTASEVLFGGFYDSGQRIALYPGCICGWMGEMIETTAEHQHLGEREARRLANDHAEWHVIEPIMMVPRA